MSYETPVQDLEDLTREELISRLQKAEKAMVEFSPDKTLKFSEPLPEEDPWVWVYICDDWNDGPIPAYKKDPEV